MKANSIIWGALGLSLPAVGKKPQSTYKGYLFKRFPIHSNTVITASLDSVGYKCCTPSRLLKYDKQNGSTAAARSSGNTQSNRLCHTKNTDEGHYLNMNGVFALSRHYCPLEQQRAPSDLPTPRVVRSWRENPVV